MRCSSLPGRLSKPVTRCLEGEYRASDGNFILEHRNVLAVYGEREVIVTFTHQPGLYAGLYHIQMDVR